MENARSFGAAADTYDTIRPSYPTEAVEWMLPPTARVVLDLGAGTGKLTQLLVAAGFDTIAVEPDVAMLARLRGSVPGARALEGAAESVPLEDASVDAVLCAQAWHWADPAVALPEVARVLRPGGTFAAIWNILDGSVPWVADLSAAVGGSRSGGSPVDLVPGAAFSPVEKAVFPWTYSLDRAGVLALVSSWSQYLVASSDERARIHRDVGAVLDTLGLETVPLPYVARCFRTRRL